MGKIIFLLFAIPVISIVVIALYQFFDEMFKKKFVLERRVRSSDDQPAGAQRRRYSDSVPPGTLRNPEAAGSGAKNDVPVPQVHGV